MLNWWHPTGLCTTDWMGIHFALAVQWCPANAVNALIYRLSSAWKFQRRLLSTKLFTTPQYLSDMLRRVADIPSRSRLRSSTSSHLAVRPSRLVTVGERVCFCWSETLEQSSGWYYYGTITTSVSKKIVNLPILAIIPGHYTVVSDCLRHGVPSSYFLL